jgi:hypothetical protein
MEVVLPFGVVYEWFSSVIHVAGLIFSVSSMDSIATPDIPFQFRKKDGTPSKMRSHKGNIPVLPQTKLCPHCPAKFTRTTHLNRHLRTREY